ncbi:MAG: AAA family ATPase [Armatimonadetes bacterium]|nr:AAA family ATPase [Armatimonadota bacterium]
MARKKDRDRGSDFHDPFDYRENPVNEDIPFEETDTPPEPELSLRAIAIVDELLASLPPEDPRTRYLLLLRHQLEVDEKQFHEARQVISQYQEAYEKLTSPANRIGTYLGSPDPGIAYIALGEGEFYANVDPKLSTDHLKIGTRVKVNEAYTVIGDLGYHTAGPIVKIGEVLEDGRLRVSMDAQGLQGRIVYRSTDLEKSALKAGQEVRLEPNGRVALESFAGQETKDYYFEEVPDVPWSKIGGQDEAIQVIRDTIELPLLYPDLYARFGKKPLKGILLFGPPGCGKTLIGKATAYNLTKEYRERTQRDVREYFMYINGPKILNMWLGESERMVREIFSVARDRAKEGFLVFIFIDEAESILRTRGSGRWTNISNTVVPQFSAEMDGLVELQNVVVMLTSNRPDYIDPAILRPERIDRKVKIGRPDRDASREILSIYLHSGVPLDPDLVTKNEGNLESTRTGLLDGAIEYLFRKTEDTQFLEVHLRSGRSEILHWKDLVSGALLMSIVERAKDAAIKRSIERSSDREGILLDDLREALRLEYKENEIFPKSDNLEDWLKLLDYEPENVVEVSPMRQKRRVVKSTVI